MRRFGTALGATMLAVSLAGCGMNSPTGKGTTGKFKGFGFGAKDHGAEWTILLHLAASNNLEPFAYINLNEAEAGLTSDKVNFLVLFDGQRSGDSKIYKIANDPAGMNKTLVSPVIDDMGAVIPSDTKEIDSGDYQTSIKFVEWAIANYPAHKYAYMSWDHGSGIFNPQGQRVNLGPKVDRMQLKSQLRKKGRNLVTEGYAWDDETGNHMTTAQFTDIAAAGAKAAGGPIDVAGFDACLMAHIEMAYQTKGHAKNLVASEELEPGLGWDYNTWMQGLSANPTADGTSMAGMLVKAYGQSYRPGGGHYQGRQQDITLSNIVTDTAINELVPALDGLAEALVGSLPTDKPAIQKARESTQEFYNSDCGDVGSFVNNLSGTKGRGNSRLKNAATLVQAVYSRTISAEDHAGASMAGATGAVLYFPTSKWQWRDAYDDPTKIAFAGTKWRDFVKEYIK